MARIASWKYIQNTFGVTGQNNQYCPPKKKILDASSNLVKINGTYADNQLVPETSLEKAIFIYWLLMDINDMYWDTSETIVLQTNVSYYMRIRQHQTQTPVRVIINIKYAYQGNQYDVDQEIAEGGDFVFGPLVYTIPNSYGSFSFKLADSPENPSNVELAGGPILAYNFAVKG